MRGGGGVSPQPPPVCSIHLDDSGASALTKHQPSLFLSDKYGKSNNYTSKTTQSEFDSNSYNLC